MSKISKQKLLVIIGPTGSGKTALSLELAKEFDGEIINADSRQFYKDFNIGTAKISAKEMKGIPHHMIDFLDGDEKYSVGTFKERVDSLISEITHRGKLPILVGGTGLYTSAVIENYEFGGAGKKEKSEPLYNYLLLSPDYNREELYKKIDSRVDEMTKEGLLDEVKKLSATYSWDSPGMLAIGYRQFKDYVEGAVDLSEAIRILKRDTRHFAKRQITWFKRYEEEVKNCNDSKDCIKKVRKWIPPEGTA